MNTAAPKFRFIFSMFIFGTIGIFVRSIGLPSSLIALVRAVIGVGFLALVMLIRRQKPDGKAIRKNLLLLIVSGILIGFNWILLFESYRYTTVATATLCYYFAPIIVVLGSPFVTGDRLTGKKLLCVLLALCGMVLISGVVESGIPQSSELLGIGLGLGAALLYGIIILMNKKILAIAAYDKTIMQLGAAGLVLIPYCLLTGAFAGISLSAGSVLLLAVVGIVHTGLAYFLYFGAMGDLPPQTIAVFSYVDPVVAVILSALLLHEPMTVYGIIGAVLILGAALLTELPERKKK
ncbi:MAG: DMT family transporter [Clostridia bacterium]|nr:DMT family transporter [Clostridia bacterium]